MSRSDREDGRETDGEGKGKQRCMGVERERGRKGEAMGEGSRGGEMRPQFQGRWWERRVLEKSAGIGSGKPGKGQIGKKGVRATVFYTAEIGSRVRMKERGRDVALL